MEPYRIIVIVDGVRTIQAVVPLEGAPRPGDPIVLPEAGNDQRFVVRHVISERRADLAGVVLAWTEMVPTADSTVRVFE
jgi:hypothetical protein